MQTESETCQDAQVETFSAHRDICAGSHLQDTAAAGSPSRPLSLYNRKWSAAVNHSRLSFWNLPGEVRNMIYRYAHPGHYIDISDFQSFVPELANVNGGISAEYMGHHYENSK